MQNPKYWQDGDIPWVSSGDVKYRILKETNSQVTRKSISEGRTTLLPKHSVIVVMRSGILRNYLPVAITSVPMAINQDIKALLLPGSISPFFILHSIDHSGDRILATCLKTGTTVESIEYPWLKKFSIPFPAFSEQQEIATALSDVDALIAGLDQLIAKKLVLKQATMQQLLTGQKRLPGFQGEWESKKLGDCLDSFPSYGINAAAVSYSDRLPAYIRITDISEDGRFKPETLVSVESSRSSQYYLQDGDIVFARTGASVGKSYRYRIQDGKLVFAGFLIRVHPNPKVLSPYFLSEFVKTEAYWKWIKLMSMRSGQPGVNGNEFAQLPIPLPAIEEQNAIAAILSDMDFELASLEQRRDKTRLIKQGMMQELITGRIRLVDPAAPAPSQPLEPRTKSVATG